MLRLLVVVPDASCGDPGLAPPSPADLDLAIARAVDFVKTHRSFAPIAMQVVKKVHVGDALNASVALLGALEDEAANGGIHAVIGPACSRACESTAFLTGARNLPQISFACQSATLSSKEQYPTVRSLLERAPGAVRHHGMLVCSLCARRRRTTTTARRSALSCAGRAGPG